MIKKLLKNKWGYTLMEIITTTAIIGTLAAVAVPNFLRVKMNANMEMVKQHLRVLGEEMNEFYNQSNPHRFPASIQEIMSGPTSEELSITASLNDILTGIDDLGYTTNEEDYEPSYTFTTCPKEGLRGIAGTICFKVGTMGVTETAFFAAPPWDGTGVPMTIWTAQEMVSPNGVNVLAEFLENSSIPYAEKIEAFADLFEYLAYRALSGQMFAAEYYTGGVYEGDYSTATMNKATASMFAVPLDRVDTYEAMIPDIYQALQSRGIGVMNKMVSYNPSEIENLASIRNTSLMNFGVGTDRYDNSAANVFHEASFYMNGQSSFSQVSFQFDSPPADLNSVWALAQTAEQRFKSGPLNSSPQGTNNGPVAA